MNETNAAPLSMNEIKAAAPGVDTQICARTRAPSRAPGGRRWPAVVTVLASLAVLVAVPYLGAPAHVQSLMYLIFFWVTMATSWNILSGYSGYFSFGHGSFFGIGMYGMASFSSKLGWSFMPSLLASGAIAAALALLIGALVFRLKKIRGESFALITLATSFVLATVIVNTPIDGGPGVFLSGVDPPKLGPLAASSFYYIGLILTVICLATAWRLLHSQLGLGLLAIHDDEDAAEINGVPAFRLKMIAFALSGFFAGAMGAVHALYVSYVTVGETFNITVPLTVVLISILGGSRHWAGPAVGAVLITLLLHAFTSGNNALIGKIIIGCVLAGTVLVLPKGILGTWQDWRHRQSLRRAHADSLADSPPAHSAPAAPEETHSLLETAAPATAQPLGEVILRAQGLSKHFSGIKALQGIDLELRQGEILGLIGPNGSGKSTFINVVSGHYRATAGSVMLKGQECTGLAAHRIRHLGISRTYQIPRPFQGLTVLQNVVLAAQYGGAKLGADEAHAEALKWMRFTGLDAKAAFLPDELNLHQRKFLELARALASRPTVLFLDEVLSGLTPAEIGAAVQTIRQIRDQGTSIVFVEHVMGAVMALSDRLVVLDQGLVIAQGVPRDVMRNEAVVRAYLGDQVQTQAQL